MRRSFLTKVALLAAASATAQTGTTADPIDLFVLALEQAAATGEREKVQALAHPEAEGAGVEDFAYAVIPAPTRLVIKELGPISTIMRTINKRGEKVYIDYLQNRHGQLIVAPYSVRPLPGATVSMPLTWDEVNGDLDPKNYTIRNAVTRMEAMGADPVLPVLEEKPKLAKVLKNLASMMDA